MKRQNRIVRWIAISIIFQVVVLSYINFIYLPNRGKVSVSAFNFSGDDVGDKTVQLPRNANGPAISYNGLYVAYKVDNRLEIYDVKAGRTIKKLEAKSGTMTYFRWLLDRDILIYSVKEPDGKKGQVQLLTYDLGGAGVERNYPKLTGLTEGSEVTDIEVSALTNVVYFMVKTSETRTQIYKYNIMDKLKFVMSARVDTIIKETGYEDNLVYSDSKDDIYVLKGSNSRKNKLSFKESLVLLEIDSEDNIYAGVLNGSGKVESIKVGKADTPEKEWKTVKLGNAASVGDIFIPDGGRIFVADRQNSKITDVSSSSSYGYKGELLDVLDDYKATLEGNKLHLTAVAK